MKIKANRLAFILEELNKKNFCVIDNLFYAILIENLYIKLINLFEQRKFKEATIGRDHRLERTIRSDKIYWWNFDDLNFWERKYIKYLKFFQKTFNRVFYIGTNSLEIFYSVYEPKSFYVKHYDNFRSSNQRKITFITYLNKEWRKDLSSGELVIYSESGVLKIEPLFNRTVIFFSEFIPHEVLPTQQFRYAITSWFNQKAYV